MKYYKDLFISSELRNKKEKIIEMIEANKILFHTYLIVVPYDSEEQLEIYDVSLNHQTYIKQANSVVIGIANGYYGAMLLVEEITKRVYNETGTANIKQYFMKRF